MKLVLSAPRESQDQRETQETPGLPERLVIPAPLVLPEPRERLVPPVRDPREVLGRLVKLDLRAIPVPQEKPG